MDEATRGDYVRDIVRSGEDLDRRITSVLEHLKVESGRFEVDLRCCDVGEELAVAGEVVVVSVIDEGPGISDADARRVFQQFERLESGRRVAHGHGVGLSAVRQLLELMGGRVWVEPNPERSSAFRFALPIAAWRHAARHRGDHSRYASALGH